MAAKLNDEVIALIDDRKTFKILATVDETGSPHVVTKQSFHVAEDGRLHYLELLESSRTNRNMVRSIWFDRPVALVVASEDGRSYQIKGKPVKVHITGELFQRHYRALRERRGDVDLAGVWVIEPQEVSNQSFAERMTREVSQRPYFRHLDRLQQVVG